MPYLAISHPQYTRFVPATYEAVSHSLQLLRSLHEFHIHNNHFVPAVQYILHLLAFDMHSLS